MNTLFDKYAVGRNIQSHYHPIELFNFNGVVQFK